MKQFYSLFKVTILIVMFLIVNISEGKPAYDGIPGAAADVGQDAVVKRFFGPWSDVRKVNGENADYNDYGAQIPDFQPSNEDQLPADSPEVSYSVEEGGFPSNYGYQSDQEEGNVSSGSSESQENEEIVEWPTSEN